MNQYNILLLCGGGSSEHNISLTSAQFLKSQLESITQFNVLLLELLADGRYRTESGCYAKFAADKQIHFIDTNEPNWHVDYVVPCIHGYPGETGTIQSWFELIHLPYFGCDPQASMNCFNKITTKLWLTALNIPNTEYIFVTELNDASITKVKQLYEQWGDLFIKAACQGSSIGCYKIDNIETVQDKLQQAFQYGQYVLVEKALNIRELEVAVYQYDKQVIATAPGEIVCNKDKFYSFEEKYDASSQTVTHVEADISPEISEKIRQYAIKAFTGMKLRDLARIDFFLTDDNQILLNEINTFPGMTPISMFPKMLAHQGHNFAQMLQQNILKQLDTH